MLSYSSRGRGSPNHYHLCLTLLPFFLDIVRHLRYFQTIPLFFFVFLNYLFMPFATIVNSIFLKHVSPSSIRFSSFDASMLIPITFMINAPSVVLLILLQMCVLEPRWFIGDLNPTTYYLSCMYFTLSPNRVVPNKTVFFTKHLIKSCVLCYISLTTSTTPTTLVSLTNPTFLINSPTPVYSKQCYLFTSIIFTLYTWYSLPATNEVRTVAPIFPTLFLFYILVYESKAN